MVIHKIKGKYLSLSEEKNTLDYLTQSYHYICQAEKSDIAWKWVVITLHGALYGFAICALKGTNPDNVKKIKKGKMRQRLISFDEAISRCQNPKWMKMTVMSKCLQLSTQQRRSIKKLRNYLRNYFEHYIPTEWIIELHGMPQIAIDVLEVIRFLALDSGNHVNLNQSQKIEVKSLVYQGKQKLKGGSLYNECLPDFMENK